MTDEQKEIGRQRMLKLKPEDCYTNIPVFVYSNADGKFVGEYCSGAYAGRLFGISKTCVNKAAHGKNDHFSGNYLFYFEFQGEYVPIQKKVGRIKTARCIIQQFDLRGNHVQTFPSLRNAAQHIAHLFKSFNSCYTGIQQSIHENLTCCGYFWRIYSDIPFELPNRRISSKINDKIIQ